MGPGGAPASGGAAAAAAPTKSVFESGKGYRLSDGKEVDEKTKAKNGRKRSEATGTAHHTIRHEMR